MAESLGVPTEFEDEPAVRMTYPWDKWAAAPYQLWMIEPDKDYPITGNNIADSCRKMQQKLHVYARRHGLSVVVSGRDPAGLNRIAFCFFEPGTARPMVWFSSSAATTSDNGAPTVTCVLCGEVAVRVPHLMHIEECLVRSTTDPRDPNMYARHRDMRPVPAYGEIVWNLEEGPKVPE